jgi:hypothetical protein
VYPVRFQLQHLGCFTVSAAIQSLLPLRLASYVLPQSLTRARACVCVCVCPVLLAVTDERAGPDGNVTYPQVAACRELIEGHCPQLALALHPCNLMRLHRNERGHVSVGQVLEVVERTVGLWQIRLDLSMYDSGGRGDLTDLDLYKYETNNPPPAPLYTPLFVKSCEIPRLLQYKCGTTHARTTVHTPHFV